MRGEVHSGLRNAHRPCASFLAEPPVSSSLLPEDPEPEVDHRHPGSPVWSRAWFWIVIILLILALLSGFVFLI
jgi:hypothetical protein